MKANPDHSESDESIDSEEENRRKQEQEERELREHQERMRKKQEDGNAMQASFRSSKGFAKKLDQQKQTNRLMIVDEGEVCPYSNCGRRFNSTEQLQQHILRRHETKAEQKPEETKRPAAAPKSTKLGSSARPKRPEPESSDF